jgi:hypothetical protein
LESIFATKSRQHRIFATMARKRRSSVAKSSSLPSPLEYQSKKKTRSNNTKRNGRATTVDGENNSLLIDLVSRLPPKHWHKILPGEGSRAAIAEGTGQPWEIIEALLLTSGLLKKDASGKSYSVILSKWNFFAELFESHREIKLHATETKKNRSKLIYYVSLGVAHRGTFRYDQYGIASPCCTAGPDADLHQRMKRACRHLESAFDAEHDKENGTGGPPLPTEDTIQQSTDEQELSHEEKWIRSGEKLDLDFRPRVTQFGEKEVQIHERKQADVAERNLCLLHACRMGYCDSKLTSQEKVWIAQAACLVVAYDRRFAKTLAWRSLQQWHESFKRVL